MSKWYEINSWSTRIVPVEVVSDTKSFVYIYNDFWKKTSRHRKEGTYYPTFEDAKAALIKRLQTHLRGYKKNILETEASLSELQARQEPTKGE